MVKTPEPVQDPNESALVGNEHAALAGNRDVRYELSMLVEGRWQIASVIPLPKNAGDRPRRREDLVAFEKEVAAAGAALLAKPKVRAVRITREAERFDGYTTSVEIKRLEGPGREEAPLRVANLDIDPPACESADDLIGRPSCRVIGLLWRSVLDKFAVNPLEILAHDGYQRRLEPIQHLVSTGIFAVASRQATLLKVPAKTRVTAIEGFYKAAQTEARAAGKGHPVLLGSGGLAELQDALGRTAPGRVRFLTFRALAQYLFGMPSQMAKLELVLKLLPPQPSAELDPYVDEMVAGYLDGSVLLKDVLGEYPNLLDAMFAIRDLAEGRPSIATGADAALLEALGRAFAGDRLPHSRAALWDRFLRSAAGKTPLTHGDRTEEWRAWETLSALADVVPSPVGEVLRQALDLRRQRLRDAFFNS